MFYFVLGNVYLSFKKADGICGFWKFWNLEMFYPPEGLCWAEPEGGPIVFTFHFIGVGRGTGGFNFRGGNPPFWNLENVLFDGVGGWVDGVSKVSFNILHTL